MAEYGRPPNASEDDDEGGGDGGGRSGGGGGGDPHTGEGGGALVLSTGTGRKPRGRPPGSKNKPKPPVVITRESEAAMRPVVLELAAGCDVLESVSRFALRRGVGVSVLSGSGAVANVTLRHPTSRTATFNLVGRFDILSLAGTFLPPPPTSASSAAATIKCPFTISLAGAQGQVIGGTVAGALTAAGPVVLVAASFVSPEFHRLPEAEVDTEDDDVKPALAAPPVYSVAASSPLAHDMVLWATPSSRAPHPPPPPHY